MTVAAGDVIRVVAKMTDINGSQIQNVYFYKHQGTVSVSDAAFLGALEVEMSTMYGHIEDNIPNTTTPLEIEADKVAFVGGDLTTLSSVGAIDWTTWAGGVGSTDGLPQGNAAVINFPSGVAGVTGRKYIGPLTEGVQNNGKLDSSILTDLGTYAADLLAGFTAVTETIQPIIMSSKQSAPVAILGAVVRAAVGYQRRRKAGRGI